MTFISSYFERFKDRVLVWEKQPGKARTLREHRASYYFYVPDKDGPFNAITGEKLKKLTFPDRASFDEACMSYPKRFESDISPLEKVMMDVYGGQAPPLLNVGLVDIEVDYDPNVGFPRPANPYAPINALTIYISDVEHYFTFVVPPKGWQGALKSSEQQTITICRDERELLDQFFSIINSVDVISGWNSEFFDLPYIGKRVELVYGESGLRKLAFEGGPIPRWTEKERFKHAKEKEIALDLNSRVHLDYMRLFKKFNLESRQSYSLAAIADEELEIPKLHYEGSLYDLYRNDFPHFVEYNIRDVEILVMLDRKFKYIELANNMVHEATVNFNAVFGSVQLIDTAIMNFAHLKLKKIVFDRTHRPKQEVEGALVLSVKRGLHGYTASCDIQSLYPSTYRTLNLSPEMIVGQLLGYEADWKKVYAARTAVDPVERQRALENTVLLQLEGTDASEAVSFTVAELLELMREQKLACSGYGTLLNQADGEGLIPAVLSSWFEGRIEMKNLSKKHSKNAKALEVEGKKGTPEHVEEVRLAEYYDMLQGVRKVLLNSSYGATLNEWCRFHDPRLGASTTGSGRQITTFMLETIVEQLVGERIPLIKTVEVDDSGEVENVYTMNCPPGIGPIMSDTDSCYFMIDALVKDDDVKLAVELADAIVKYVNDSFPKFIETAFGCQPEFLGKIKANREIVARKGLIRAKKNYAFMVVNNEGVQYDEPKLKFQGGDIKVKSTPEIVRSFLTEMTIKILKGATQEELVSDIIKFRDVLSVEAEKNPLAYATVQTVKTLDAYQMKWERQEKVGLGRVTLPGHIRAAINYNACIEQFAPAEAPIVGGAKVKIVCLKDNELGYKTIAFPSDFEVLPKWFTDRFEIDVKLTESKMIDAKVGNTFHPIGWEVPTRQSVLVNKLLDF